MKSRRDLWEVHRDPYDVTRIWVRNHHHGGWIEAIWTYLNAGPAPFGDLAWDHAQRMLARRGTGKPTEDQIARAASDLLDRAGQGPAGKRDLRVAARNSASSPTRRARPRRHPRWQQKIPTTPRTRTRTRTWPR